MNNSLADIKRLMADAAVGNKDAWDDLVKGFDDEVIRATRHALHSYPRFKSQLHDLTQSFWHTMYHDRERLTGIDSPQRWLAYLGEVVKNKVRLVARQSMAERRGGKRTHKSIEQLDEERESDQIHDRGPAVIDEAILHEELARLLASEPPKRRAIIELLIQGFTHEEVAKKLGISRSGVSRYIDRLRRKHLRLLSV